MLDGTLHRTSAELGVVAFLGKEATCIVGHAQLDVALLQQTVATLQLDVHYAADVVLGEGAEVHDLVDTVQELATDGLHRAAFSREDGLLAVELVLGEVRGHDDDGVLEVDVTSLAIGHMAFVKHLQQRVEHVGVCLLDLVEEHHLVGLAAYGLGELSALLVAYVSWRRTEQTCYGELLLVLRHVDTCHHPFVVEEEFGQGLGKFGLAHARLTQEEERTDGSVGVGEACTVTTDGVRHSLDGHILAYYALVQLGLELEQLVAFRGHHLVHGDARPVAYHFGDVLGSDLFADQRIALAHLLVQVVRDLLVLLLQARDGLVLDLGHLAVVALLLGLFGLEAQLLHLFLVALDDFNQLLLLLPLVVEFLLFGLQRLDLLVDVVDLGLVLLPLDGLALDLELHDLTMDFVQGLWFGVTLHTQFGRSLVNQVDGLVGEVAVGDVTRREAHGLDHGLVLDTDVVVVLVALLQATQDGDGSRLVGLIHHYLLESALQGLVGLEVLLVFVEGGGAHATQFATCQSRLQDVGGIHRALTAACAHQGVDLVDEEDDVVAGGIVAVGFLHLLDDALQSVLELALVHCTGYQCAHVERVDLLLLQVLGYVTAHDTLCQALRNGGLACTRLADQYGVVLGPSTQDLQHTSDFLVTTNHGVELSLSGELTQVLGILVQCLLTLLLGVWIIHVCCHSSIYIK